MQPEKGAHGSELGRKLVAEFGLGLTRPPRTRAWQRPCDYAVRRRHNRDCKGASRLGVETRTAVHPGTSPRSCATSTAKSIWTSSCSRRSGYASTLTALNRRCDQRRHHELGDGLQAPHCTRCKLAPAIGHRIPTTQRPRRGRQTRRHIQRRAQEQVRGARAMMILRGDLQRTLAPGSAELGNRDMTLDIRPSRTR